MSSTAEYAQGFVLFGDRFGRFFLAQRPCLVGEDGVSAGLLRTVRSVGTTMTKFALELLGQLCLAVGGELESKLAANRV